MRALIELNGRKHILTMKQAEEVITLIHSYGAEVYESRKDWNTKTVQHYIYEVSPTELGTGDITFLTDALYGMGKLKGRPE
jgi:hypothetical protein